MMNMSEIRFKTSFIIDILRSEITSFTISVQHENVYQRKTISCSFWFRQSRSQFNTKMYTSGIHFHAPFGSANHDSSSTRKCTPAVYNFVLLLVPPITISVQHENVYQRYTISCSFWFRQSQFQFNTKMYTSGIQFRALSKQQICILEGQQSNTFTLGSLVVGTPTLS